MKFIYSDINGNLHVVHPAKKSSIEKDLGRSLTAKEYRDFVIAKSIPEGAIGVREVSITDIPTSREFREAWCDVTAESRIDIDCTKAKEVQLKRLRTVRDAELDKTDKLYTKALELGEDMVPIKQRRQQLRDATEALKAVDTTGKVNDSTVLSEILLKGKLPT